MNASLLLTADRCILYTWLKTGQGEESRVCHADVWLARLCYDVKHSWLCLYTIVSSFDDAVWWQLKAVLKKTGVDITRYMVEIIIMQGMMTEQWCYQRTMACFTITGKGVRCERQKGHQTLLDTKTNKQRADWWKSLHWRRDKSNRKKIYIGQNNIRDYDVNEKQTKEMKSQVCMLNKVMDEMQRWKYRKYKYLDSKQHCLCRFPGVLLIYSYMNL